ncbi:MAG TPA: hypothetical protein VLQ67_10145 [Arachnia sp.]|nr:hypothetical protein [Arachnia sp.]
MTTTNAYSDIPELAPLNLSEKPDGPGSAIILSAGIGIFTLGLLCVLAEASEGVNAFLSWFQAGLGVGALAGKTIVAVVLYVGSLIALWVLWKDKDVSIKGPFFIALALGVLGAIMMYPPVFTLFAA